MPNSQILKYFSQEKLGHGYLLIGNVAFAELKPTFAKILNSNLKSPHPDLFVFDGNIGIEAARKIKQNAYTSPLSSHKKIFYLNANNITPEAQNALLKVLEEPPANTHFFINTATLDMLLPTLKSRLIPLRVKQKQAEEPDLQTIKHFIKLPFIEKTKDEKTLEIKFINAAENYLWSKNAPKNSYLVNKLQNYKRILKYRALSPKLYKDYISALLERP